MGADPVGRVCRKVRYRGLLRLLYRPAKLLLNRLFVLIMTSMGFLRLGSCRKDFVQSA